MVNPTRIGARIRAQRLDQGFKQADLARTVGISPSYLNLIEHDRRRIAGALLSRLAQALGIGPELLSDGVETTLTTALGAAADVNSEVNPEIARLDEFAARFPGWARVIERQGNDLERLGRLVEALSDRLTYDPFLSASMHEVLSSVTAVRSASAILAQGTDISPEWQARFHRNIFEDSQRLAESTESLVAYLDAGGNTDGAATMPQEEVDAWLASNDWQLTEVEADLSVDPEGLAKQANLSRAATALAADFINRYQRDAERIPLAPLKAALIEIGAEPAALAARFSVGLPAMFRRLSSLKGEDFPDGQTRGLVACDASGTLTFRKPVEGFDVPRYGAACSLWPLFQSIQRPMTPVRQFLETGTRDAHRFVAYAFAEAHHPNGFDGVSVVEAWMLIAQDTSSAPAATPVGVSCRICAVDACPARREPSIVAVSRGQGIAENDIGSDI